MRSFLNYLVNTYSHGNNVKEYVVLRKLNIPSEPGSPVCTCKVSFNHTVEVKIVERIYTSTRARRKNFYTEKDILRFNCERYGEDGNNFFK